jgi:hypothetical protein
MLQNFRKLQRKVRLETKLILYKVMASPLIFYDSATGSQENENANNFQETEIKFFKKCQRICIKFDKIKKVKIYANN